MLQKLRSRHPIDLPVEGFGHKKVILAVLGGLFLLFVALPFLLSPLAAARENMRLIVAVAAGFAALLLALLVGAAIGKKGWDRS